jgi:hypothetical protein
VTKRQPDVIWWMAMLFCVLLGAALSTKGFGSPFEGWGIGLLIATAYIGWERLR